MHVTQSYDEFVAAIYNEKRIVNLFVEVLKKEEIALTHGQIDELDLLVSEKAQLVEQLEELEKNREQYLLSFGCTPDKNGMHSWLSKQEDMELQAVWNELIEMAKIAKQVNQVNGQMISTQQLYNQRAYLSLQSAAGNISLYGPKGQAFT